MYNNTQAVFLCRLYALKPSVSTGFLFGKIITKKPAKTLGILLFGLYTVYKQKQDICIGISMANYKNKVYSDKTKKSQPVSHESFYYHRNQERQQDQLIDQWLRTRFPKTCKIPQQLKLTK